MDSKPFYCTVVGESITADICEDRVKQDKELRAKDDPHPSLNKCIICKGLEPTETPAAPEVAEPLAKAQIICPYCKRLKVYKKLRWNKKRGMRVNCYHSSTKKAAEPEVKVTRLALGIKVTTAEPPEDPERIIQCSASPSWACCHDCYAVKNCALYDAAVSVADTVAGLEETPASIIPDTTEQDHYTACAIQPIEFIVANSMDFLEGNIVKYVARYKRKNGLEDLAKARHYLDMLIKRETT